MTAPSSLSYLPSLAALHVFLAQHPDLAEPPIRWSFDGPEGLYGLLPRDSAGLELLGRIAAAAGAEVEASRPFECGKDRIPTVLHCVDTTVHGVRLQATVSVPADPTGGAT